METESRAAMPLSKAVAKEIRKLLVDFDMTQTALAERMGMSEMWVSRRLRGAQPIDLNDLQLFAEVFGMTPGDLLPRANDGRVITVSGATNGRSGHTAGRLRHGSSRTITKLHAPHPHPVGRPETGTTAPTPAGPPTQRRAALITHRPGN